MGTLFGYWENYGQDGRLKCHEEKPDWWDNKGHQIEAIKAGLGYRAYDASNPHGGDYAWGPLADTLQDAQRALLAEKDNAAEAVIDRMRKAGRVEVIDMRGPLPPPRKL